MPVVRLLLDHHATIDAKTNRGNTALHIASLAGRSEIIRLLVERGADVNARSQVILHFPITHFSPFPKYLPYFKAEIIDRLFGHLFSSPE